MARDNNDVLCSPCRLYVVFDQHQPNQVDPALGERHAKFRQGGIHALAEELSTTPQEAIAVAIHEGMLPRRWRSSQEKLCALLDLEGLKHVEAAEQLGVSRWTIATWRDQLGLQAKRRRRQSSAEVESASA